MAEVVTSMISIKSSYMKIRKIYKLILFDKILMKKRRLVRVLHKKDFSNNVVITLLVLLVVVSIMSITLYFTAVSGVEPQFVVNEGKTTGEVAITITPVPTELASEKGNHLNNQNVS